MKKIVLYSPSALGVVSIVFIGIIAYGLFVMNSDDERTFAHEEYIANNQPPTADEYDIYNHPPTAIDLATVPNVPTKGEYGHETLSHREGNGIDSVKIDKTEYANVKELIDDMNDIFNGNAKDKVQWSSQFAKKKYFAGSIIVYVNHFINNESVNDEKATLLKDLQDVARNVHNLTNEADSNQSDEALKKKIAEVHSTIP